MMTDTTRNALNNILRVAKDTRLSYEELSHLARENGTTINTVRKYLDIQSKLVKGSHECTLEAICRFFNHLSMYDEYNPDTQPPVEWKEGGACTENYVVKNGHLYYHFQRYMYTILGFKPEVA